MLEFLYKKYQNIDKRKAFKIICMLVIIYVVFCVFENIVNADILDAMGEPESFKNLIGEAKYLQSPYRSNYYLDVKSLGLTDLFNKFTNWSANLLWSGVTILTYILLIVFNLGFSMDIADMFSGILDTIMTALKTSIFDEYFLLIVSIAVIYVAISFVRNNLGQVFSRLGYIVLTIVLMFVSTMYSANIVSGITTLSKSIGASSIVAISNRETTEDNIGQVAGELWGNLVHKPWLELEFDGKQGEVENLDGVVDKILSLPGDSEERQNYIDELNKSNKELFKESVGTGRILPSLLILIVNVVKMGVMIVLSVIQIVFQIVTILFVLAFPFMLLLSISPSFGGVNLISNLGNQILGSQVGIVLTSFLLGLMIKLDGLIATYLGGLGTYGWFAITIIQTAIYVGVIWQRKQIFRILMSMQSKISSSSAGVWRNVMKTTDKTVDGAKSAGGYAADKVKGGANSFREAVEEKANNFGDKVRDFHAKHFDKETLGEKIRNYNKEKENERRKQENIKYKNTKSPGDNKAQNTSTSSVNKEQIKSEDKSDNIKRPKINYRAMKGQEHKSEEKLKNKEETLKDVSNNMSNKLKNEEEKVSQKKDVNKRNETIKTQNIDEKVKKDQENKGHMKNITDEMREKALNKEKKSYNNTTSGKLDIKPKMIEKVVSKDIKNTVVEKDNRNIKDRNKIRELDIKNEKLNTNISSIDRAKMFNKNNR